MGVGFRSINVALRKEFDLCAAVRPVVTLMPGGRCEDIDQGLFLEVGHEVAKE